MESKEDLLKKLQELQSEIEFLEGNIQQQEHYQKQAIQEERAEEEHRQLALKKKQTEYIEMPAEEIEQMKLINRILGLELEQVKKINETNQLELQILTQQVETLKEKQLISSKMQELQEETVKQIKVLFQLLVRTKPQIISQAEYLFNAFVALLGYTQEEVAEMKNWAERYADFSTISTEIPDSPERLSEN